MRLAGLVIVFLAFMSEAKEIRICNECEQSDFALAVTNAQPFDTILIEGGIHPSVDVVIDKPLIIKGINGAVLDGQNKAYIVKILSDSVTISSLKLINAGRSYTKDYAAVYVSKSKGFLIEMLEVIDPLFGILIEKSADGIVRNNEVYGPNVNPNETGNGIHLWHSKRIIILDNNIHQMRDGIYLEFVDESTVEGNHAHNNIRYGLHFMFSNHDNYLANSFEQNGAGVAVMFSKFIRMENNHFKDNWGPASYGLLLKEIYDAEVVNNLFEENTMAIFLEGSTRINYMNNTFKSNGWGVKVSGGCYTNIFRDNNFMGNSFDVSYNTKMNDNAFEGNFWSEYSGYDLDRDGTGDVPYRPVKLFSYIVNRTPETVILLRSLFIDIINFSEKVSPAFTPDELVDAAPKMKPTT